MGQLGHTGLPTWDYSLNADGTKSIIVRTHASANDPPSANDSMLMGVDHIPRGAQRITSASAVVCGAGPAPSRSAPSGLLSRRGPRAPIWLLPHAYGVRRRRADLAHRCGGARRYEMPATEEGSRRLAPGYLLSPCRPKSGPLPRPSPLLSYARCRPRCVGLGLGVR